MRVLSKAIGLLGATASVAVGQVVAPVWVEHLNGEVGVSPADRLPILRKNVGASEAPNGVADGTSMMVSFGKMQRYDGTRLLLMVRENGINETDPGITPADQALAAQYPDRSLIWIDASNGKPLGVAKVFGVNPINVSGQGTQYDFFQEWGIDDDGLLYSTHKNVILRWAKTGTDTWSATPTCAWTEPTPDATDCSGSPLDGSSGGDGNVSWRWRDFRVSGSGVNTVIMGGGGTWRASMHLQIFHTTNGLTFFPISRQNDRDGGYKGNYSQGGLSSKLVRHNLDPTRPNLVAVYHGRYPGTGWEARPDRFLEDLDNPFRTLPDTYAASGKVAVFETGDTWNWSFTNNNRGDVLNYPASPAGPNGQWGGLPAFRWEAAGKDGLPINHTVDGLTRYDGNWSCAIDADSSLDYVINYAMPSWNNQFTVSGTNVFKPGWISAHRLDGSISANSAWQLPCTEMDIQTPDEGQFTGNTWGYDGDVTLYPDTAAPANLKKANLMWVGSSYGFGLFTVQNVAAAITSEPADATFLAGTTNTISATVAGSPNLYRWLKNGVPLTDGRYTRGSKTASLQLLEVVKADAGVYTLAITNPLSGVTFSRSAKIQIAGAYVRPHQNAALVGAASQISTYPTYPASLAIDGNTNTAWGGGSIAHTDATTNSPIWWEVDLKSTQEIGRITYFPRSDCCQDRQADVNVVILDAARLELSRTNINVAGFNLLDPWAQDYVPTVMGRYVRIERFPVGAPDVNGFPLDAYLNIAEVQVFTKFRPTMDIGIYNNQIMVAWDSDAFSTPKLQQSDSLTGGWTDVTTITPYLGSLSATTKFYRLVAGP